MILLQQMMILFIYMLIGYVLCKKNVFDMHISKGISWLVINIANPMIIISSAISGGERISGGNLVQTALLALGTFVSMALLSNLIPVIFRVDHSERELYRMVTIFNNIGFMGIPVVSAVYGSEALLYTAIFIFMFNLVFYTYGIAMFSGEKNGIQVKSILNVGVIACLITMVLYLADIKVPDFFMKIIMGLSNLTTPLSMMVIGISLAYINIKEMFADRRLVLYSGVKLLIIPIIGTLIVKQLVSSQMICSVFMIMIATPAASINAMIAQQYNKNVELAAEIVAFTTLLSVFTIPIVSWIVF